MSRLAAIVVGVLALLLLLFGTLAVRSCSAARTAGATTGLANDRAQAASDSGHDAVQTIGNSQANEAVVHDQVEDGTDAIRNAPAGNSNDAAERAACGLRAYRNSERCVALLGPTAK